MSRATSPSTARRYGLARVCRAWRIARSTLYRHRAQAALPPEQRPVPRQRGPRIGLTDAELTARIRALLTTTGFHGKGHRKVWARLRLQGVRTSQGRGLRLMRAAAPAGPPRVGRPHGPRAHDGTIITERPEAMWGTDMTLTWTTREGPVGVFLAVDHCTAACVGLHAATRGTRFEALEPIRQAVPPPSAAMTPASPPGGPSATTTAASIARPPSRRS